MIVSTHIALSELDDVFDLDNCLSGFQLTLVFFHLIRLSFAYILVYVTPIK